MCLHVCLRCAELSCKQRCWKSRGEWPFSPFSPPKILLFPFVAAPKRAGQQRRVLWRWRSSNSSSSSRCGERRPSHRLLGSVCSVGQNTELGTAGGGASGWGWGRGLNIIAGRSSGKTSGGCPRLTGAEWRGRSRRGPWCWAGGSVERPEGHNTVTQLR